MNIKKGGAKMTREQNKIRCKAILGLPLTQRERALYLLYLSTLEQAKDFLKREQQKNEKI